MTSHPFHQTEIDERAFGLFLIEGIQFFLNQDPPLRHGSVHEYATRLWNRWIQMSENEKAPFIDRVIEELRRMHRYRHSDIYRDVMRDDTNDTNDVYMRRRDDSNDDNETRRRRRIFH
jgi:hypothetical protein